MLSCPPRRHLFARKKQRQIAALAGAAPFCPPCFLPLTKKRRVTFREAKALSYLPLRHPFFPKSSSGPCFSVGSPLQASPPLPGPHIAAAALQPRERLRSAAFLPHFYRLFAQIFLFYLCDLPCQTTEQQYNKTCLQRGELPQRRLACETSKPALFQRAGCF